MQDGVLVRFAGIAKEFMVYKTLDLGFTTIRWYGIIIAFGFTLAVLFGGRCAYKWKISLDKMIDILLWGTIGGIIGARLYYVAFKWDYYSQNLGEIVKIWEGGLAIYGGIIGGLLCAFIVCKVEKVNFLNLLDMASMSLLIGQGIGRWGNFANQEAFGTFTGRNWGMMSDTVAEYIELHPELFGLEGVKNIPDYISKHDLFVHPTFFYESVWCLLGFALLFLCLKKFRKFSGQLFLSYGLWYGIGRAVIEGMRTDSLYVGDTNLRVSQLLSAVLAGVCFILLLIFLIRFTKHPKPIEGIDFFPPKTEKELAAEEKAKARKDARKKRKDLAKRAKELRIRDGVITNKAAVDESEETFVENDLSDEEESVGDDEENGEEAGESTEETEDAAD